MNWTIETIFSLISWILIVATALEHLHLYLRTRIKSFLFLCLSWFSFSIYIGGEFFSYLFLSEILFRLHYIPLVFTGFYLILFVDLIKQENAGKAKIAILSALSALIMYTSIEPGSVLPMTFPDGAESLQTTGYLKLFILCFTFIFAIVYMYHIGLLNKNTPSNLKKYSRVAFTGTIIFCIIPAFSYATGLTVIVPGIHVLAWALGGIVTTWAFAKQPKLAYILPFKVIRLLVIDGRNGLGVFDHAWTKEGILAEGSLVSGMIQGINSILQESFQKGNCKEILLDQGVMMLQFTRESPFIVVLITSKSSTSLRHSLSMFADGFIKQYVNIGEKKYFAENDFKGVDEIVAKYFPYIPDYT